MRVVTHTIETNMTQTDRATIKDGQYAEVLLKAAHRLCGDSMADVAATQPTGPSVPAEMR